MPEPVPTAAVPAPATSLPPGPRDSAIETKVRVEFVRMAYQELNDSTVAVTLTALGYAVGLSLVGQDGVWWWFAFFAALSAARFWLTAAFQRAQPTADESRSWGLKFIIVTTLTSAAFGSLVWIFPVLHLAPFRTAHILVLAGITVGSSRILLPMRKGHLIHLLVMMVPLALSFFADADLTTGVGLGACVLLFIAYTAFTNLRNHQTLSDALVMRFEREVLANQLAVENRRREARETELQEAREKAEMASTAKGEFLAVISHEIRTPMNGVLGMLRIVRDTPLTSEQRGYLRTASDSAEALLLLLNDVLDFSKIEAGKLELEMVPFPPATMAKSVVDLLHARARDKGLQLELVLGDNLPGAIMGDSARLRQIIVNLIGNAIKFTEKGKVELSVICAERTATKAMMHFTVTDTGIGIDSAAQERLFKPFVQADTSMSRKYGGTGLGLAISQRITQAMGGALQVSSVLNKGSTFRVIVPCLLPEITPAVAAAETPKFVTPTLAGRVLVVEDDSVNRQVIELFLRKIGLTPTFALDGESAITSATTQPFDIVLMDCQLPGIDGLEATRRIRTELAGRPLTIVALTANASTTVRENCLAAGMNDFLSKPVRFELLCTVLQRHLPAT